MLDSIALITFASGVSVAQPTARLAAFLEEEYDWYDAIADPTPDQVTPHDVLVASGINAFGRGGASVAKLRRLHGELARRCNPMLGSLPVESDLTELDDLGPLTDLILEGTYAPGALASVVTKILHRKRRHLIPVLDSVMVEQYCSPREAAVLGDSYASAQTYRSSLLSVLGAVRADVRQAMDDLIALAAEPQMHSWPLIEKLRIHDILVWTELEPQGYYRTKISPSSPTQ